MLLRSSFAALMLATLTPAIPGQLRLWENLYVDPVMNSRAVAVASAPADHTWVLSRMGTPGAGYHYRLLLVNSAGAYVRHVDLRGLPNSLGDPWDLPADVVCDEQGNAYVLGGSFTANGNVGLFLFSCGMDGVLRWSAYGPHDNHLFNYSGVELILTPGNVLVALGEMTERYGTDKYLTVDSFDLSGGRLWSNTWGSFASGAAVAADQAGNVYAVGSQAGGVSYWAAILVKFAPDGRREWVYTYDGAFEFNHAQDVDVNAAGVPVVAGDTSRAFISHPLAFSVSPSGNLLWEHIGSVGTFAYNAGFRTLNARPDGGWRLVGTTNEFADQEVLLEDLDADGLLMHKSHATLARGANPLFVNGLVTDKFGCSTAVGFFGESSVHRGFICQFGPDGSIAGSRVFDRGNRQTNQVFAVCHQSDGAAVIAGYRPVDNGSSPTHAWVMSYAPQGIAQVIGGGCPGSQGVPAISWTGSPSLQSGSIEIAVANARPGAAAALLIASQGVSRRLTSSCEVLVSLKDARPVGVTSTDAFGSARLTYSLPPRPALSGISLHAQWLIEDPAGTPYHARTISASEVAVFRLGF